MLCLDQVELLMVGEATVPVGVDFLHLDVRLLPQLTEHAPNLCGAVNPDVDGLGSPAQKMATAVREAFQQFQATVTLAAEAIDQGLADD